MQKHLDYVILYREQAFTMGETKVDVGERLAALRVKRLDAVKKNRRLAYIEAKEQGSGVDGNDTNTMSDVENDNTGKHDSALESLRVLSYTIQEDEDWSNKQGGSTTGVNGAEEAEKNPSTINDFRTLAERTYRKHVAQMAKVGLYSDREATLEKKRRYADLLDQGYSEVEATTILTDPDAVKRESTRIKTQEARVYKRRGAKHKRATQDHGIAINERNRAFNEKLKREMREREG